MGKKDELKALYDAYTEDPRFEHLRKLNRNFVPGSGPLRASLMLIGEAPGSMENIKRMPFVGRAGINLNNLLSDVGIDPEDVFTTNAVKYWPEGRQADHNKTIYTPTLEEVVASRDYLRKEVSIVEPLVVGLCGRTAINAVFPKLLDVFHNHGRLLENLFVPLYHPARITYQPWTKSAVKEGYAKLAGILQAKSAA
jgi:uracil-DNA glycosylase family 4